VIKQRIWAHQGPLAALHLDVECKGAARKQTTNQIQNPKYIFKKCDLKFKLRARHATQHTTQQSTAEAHVREPSAAAARFPQLKSNGVKGGGAASGALD